MVFIKPRTMLKDTSLITRVSLGVSWKRPFTLYFEGGLFWSFGMVDVSMSTLYLLGDMGCESEDYLCLEVT